MAGDGLASVKIYNDDNELETESIFSFSEAVWKDMLAGSIIIEQDDAYVIYEFNNIDKLPHGHQRSVLIKNFEADITNEITISKRIHPRDLTIYEQALINHYKKNNNHHTTSDFNYVGLRVLPDII